MSAVRGRQCALERGPIRRQTGWDGPKFSVNRSMKSRQRIKNGASERTDIDPTSCFGNSFRQGVERYDTRQSSGF